jgi:hypothetical protein
MSFLVSIFCFMTWNKRCLQYSWHNGSCKLITFDSFVGVTFLNCDCGDKLFKIYVAVSTLTAAMLKT